MPNNNKVKFCIGAVLFLLLLLLSKGFSFALPKARPIQNEKQQNTTCLQVESVKECRPCTGHEMKFLKICEKTGNIEEIVCKKPQLKYMDSCPFAVKAEFERFWVFEGCVTGIALISNLIVWFRRKSLDVVKYQKLKRQISDLI